MPRKATCLVKLRDAKIRTPASFAIELSMLDEIPAAAAAATATRLNFTETYASTSSGVT